MKLLVVRHAIAAPHGAAGVADSERPLTREGELKFREAARGLASGSFEQQAEVLDEYDEDATVAVFGHEPWVSQLVARLVGTGDENRLAFKKGAAALVDVPGRLAEGGSLVWFLPPKLLRKLG